MEIQSGLNEVIRLMTTVSGLSSLSVMLHVLGYLAFLFYSERMKFKPNSVSWFMFAYGTTITAILERDAGASLPVLALPYICAMFSIWIAFRCLKNGAGRLPKDMIDWLALGADLTITICYVLVIQADSRGFISQEIHGQVVFGLLAASSATTILPFISQFRGMSDGTTTEHWLPWILWATAYAFLAVTTVSIYGLWTPLILYPVINMVLHVFVFLYVISLSRKRTTGTVR